MAADLDRPEMETFIRGIIDQVIDDKIDTQLNDELRDEIDFELRDHLHQSEVIQNNDQQMIPEDMQEKIAPKSNPVPDSTMLPQLPNITDNKKDNFKDDQHPSESNDNSDKKDTSSEKYGRTNEENYSYLSENELGGLITPMKKLGSPTDTILDQSQVN